MRALRAGLGFAAFVTAAVPLAAQMPPPTKPVQVQLTAGKIEGDARADADVFLGVPYAAPPVGALRWAAPQPVKPWSGVRTATAVEPACVQPVDPDYRTANGGGVVGAQSEDCLYLQVFRPKNAAGAPVVVWFHGGAYFLGAGSLGSYDGTANARQGVITVTVNYRLGPLGGFVHPALLAANKGKPVGNYALMDAIAALRWVQANIGAFGGDVGNVTVAGQSAGGGIVTGLLSAPSAKGLYHKAIIQSGALLYPDRDPAKTGQAAAEALAPLGIGAGASLADLRTISAQSLASRDPLRRGWFFIKDPAFKPQSLAEALDAGTEIDVPLLIGANGGEPGFANARKIAELAGDSGAPTFLYRFDYVPQFRKSEWTKGPIHSAELMFTFASIDQSSWGGSRADLNDRGMATLINGCWNAFFKMAPGARGFTCPNGYAFAPYDTSGAATRFGQNGPEAIDARPLGDGPPRPAS